MSIVEQIAGDCKDCYIYGDIVVTKPSKYPKIAVLVISLTKGTVTAYKTKTAFSNRNLTWKKSYKVTLEEITQENPKACAT